MLDSHVLVKQLVTVYVSEKLLSPLLEHVARLEYPNSKYCIYAKIMSKMWNRMINETELHKTSQSYNKGLTMQGPL